ncbi:MAG: MotA/TolQ/ExbB proton channel family protein [Epsilonproteobacteria bacterium]|nr:MAG: MotA/TolQ/ExbB proton channel family protein [Campylobacterota bacterium]
MEFLTYIERGGIIVYILICMNIIGFTIMLWKSFVFFKANKDIDTISNQLIEDIKDSTYFQVAQIQSLVALKVKSLESGLNTVKLIASISPLIGLLGTVIGILNSFDNISHLGLGDPTVFSSGISLALITTVAGLIVAIPHYIGYNYFIGALDNIEIKLEKIILDKI